jgi:hypothetical protein
MSTNSFLLICPYCQGGIDVPNELYGQVIECPSCSHKVDTTAPIPAPRAAAAPNRQFHPVHDEHLQEIRDRRFARWLKSTGGGLMLLSVPGCMYVGGTSEGTTLWGFIWAAMGLIGFGMFIGGRSRE